MVVGEAVCMGEWEVDVRVGEVVRVERWESGVGKRVGVDGGMD